MAESALSIQQSLASLRASYARDLPGDLQQIDDVWQKLVQHWQLEQLTVLHRMVHTIAGSGATFGFPALSKQARALELVLNGFLKQPAQSPGAAVLAEAGALLAGLRDEKLLVQEEAPVSAVRANALFDRSDEKLIYLLDAEESEAAYLLVQLRNFGYAVRVFDTSGVLVQALAGKSPAAIIVDPAVTGFGAIAAAVAECHPVPPMMVISAQNDFESRLAAVRAGAKAYFTKPLDAGSLNSKLDELVAKPETAPYRVLLVDDSPFMLAYHESVLRQAGVVTCSASDPMAVMGPIVEFNPDLILMDIYMPHCNGLELAAVIRQQEAHAGIPIVYLSGENDFTKELSAMSLGGDEFLTKPIDPKKLISVVTSRSHRSRLLRSFMLRDSLTGLLNHNRVKEQLELEVARAARQNMPLSVVMIDIDLFKQVNDSHGHEAGDRVIKNLARLLQKSLRRTDIIGRYGGEEFMVVLPNTGEADAARVIDNVRTKFLAIRQLSQRGEFSVSFSAGTAGYPAQGDAAAMVSAAGHAVTQAKNNGRNCVMLSS